MQALINRSNPHVISHTDNSVTVSVGVKSLFGSFWKKLGNGTIPGSQRCVAAYRGRTYYECHCVSLDVLCWAAGKTACRLERIN